MVPKTLLKSFSYRELRSLRNIFKWHYWKLGDVAIRVRIVISYNQFWQSLVQLEFNFENKKSPDSDEFKEKALEIVSEYKHVGFLMLVDLPGQGSFIRPQIGSVWFVTSVDSDERFRRWRIFESVEMVSCSRFQNKNENGLEQISTGKFK